MYGDDSITEIKLTDVTHCDLETKSILKPPKIRAPLQEVDLGNQITVEFDVIRKRRVSFAGVNKVKEFNSEAKSFSVYNTPAYDEKVSTSSDSSALSSSITGNINSWTKENDSTILDDTMDLTDLSIVQPSCAMDITIMKPQNSLQGVADIYAHNNQGGQLSTNSAMFVKKNRENEKCVTDTDPLQFFSSQKSLQPAQQPSVPDPTKVLLNELLEESVVDFPVDKYLQANSIFVQNKYPLPSVANRNTLGENKYSLSSEKKTSEIMVTEALLNHVIPVPENSVKFESQKKAYDICQANQEDIPLNLFCPHNLEMNKSLVKQFEGNASNMEITDAIPSWKSIAFQSHGQNREELKSLKGLSISHMEFTEAVPFKDIHSLENLIDQKYTRQSENVCTISQMEFTEALPSKIFDMANSLKQENLPADDESAPFKMNSSKNLGSSNMEFTEALQIHKLLTKCNNAKFEYATEIHNNPAHRNLVSGSHINETSVMDISICRDELKLNSSKVGSIFKKPDFIGLESNNHCHNLGKHVEFFERSDEKSHMEFTEALPVCNPSLGGAKYVISKVSGTTLPMKNQIIDIENIPPQQKDLNDSNCMEVTDFNDSPTIFCYGKHERNSEKIDIGMNVPVFEANNGFNERNISQMEFTEALPSKDIQGNIIKTKQQEILFSNGNEGIAKMDCVAVPYTNQISSTSSFMKFTEALPLYKQWGVNCRDNEKECSEKNTSHNVKIPALMQNNSKMFYKLSGSQSDEIVPKSVNKEKNLSYDSILLQKDDNVRCLQQHHVSSMEFALPSRNSQSDLETKEPLLNNPSPYVTVRKSIPSANNCTLQTKTTVLYSKETSPQYGEDLQSVDKLHDSILKENVNDSCSMDVTEMNNKIAKDILSNINENVNIDVCVINREIVKSTACSVFDQLSEDNYSLNPTLHDFGKHVELREIQKTQSSISEIEFTEGLPCKNMTVTNSETGIRNFINDKTTFKINRKNTIPSNENCTFDYLNKEIEDVSPLNIIGEAVHPAQLQSQLGDIFVPSNINPKANVNKSLDISQMEFTEAVHPAQLQSKLSDLVKEPYKFTTAVPSEDQLINVNPERNLTKSSEISQMEFTEAVDLKQLQMKPDNLVVAVDKVTKVKESSDQLINLISERNESKLPEISQMESTEAVHSAQLQSKLTYFVKKTDTFVTAVQSDDQLINVIHERNVSKSPEISQMEFTEAVHPAQLLSKLSDYVKEQDKLKTAVQSHDQLLIVHPERNVSKSPEISQMEFTEAVDPKLLQLKANDLVVEVGKITKVKESSDQLINLISERNDYKLPEISQMEFTEAVDLKQLHMKPDDLVVEVDKVTKVKESSEQLINLFSERSDCKLSQMESTEAVHSAQLQSKFTYFVKGSDKLTTPVPSSDQLFNVNCEGNVSKSLEISQMEFTEAVHPAQLQSKLSDYVKEQDKLTTPVPSSDQLININPEKTVSESLEISQMEFTNAITEQSSAKKENKYPKHFISELCLNLVKDDMKHEYIPPIQNLKLDTNHQINNNQLKLQLITNDVTNQQPDETLLVEKIKNGERVQVNTKNEVNFTSQVSSERVDESLKKRKIKNDKPAFTNNFKNSTIVEGMKSKSVVPVHNFNESCINHSCFDVAKSFECNLNIKENDSCTVRQNIVGTIKNDPLDGQAELTSVNHVYENAAVKLFKTCSSENINRNLEESEICETNYGHCSPKLHSDNQNFITSQQSCATDLLSCKDSLRQSLKVPNNHESDGIMNRICKNNMMTESITGTVVENNYDHKKNLVHFNTPPIRNIKKRKTMGPSDFDESKKLSQASCSSDLSLCFADCSADVSKCQKKIFEEERKPLHDLEKGKDAWDRLVKNYSFMKKCSFGFVSPVRWKYMFKWPLELFLEIPDIEVNENSRKKNINLLSKISQSDPISIFVDNRMKRNMSVILTEKWLNSHCKTIKDLLLTIKFIEEEYRKLDQLISSMKYFYQEFPFDFVDDRIIFTIVNVRKEYCFEINIDVSYGQVKGKNIDVINHVGQISKSKVQQLFDQLTPNTERFLLFWHKLKKAHELKFFSLKV